MGIAWIVARHLLGAGWRMLRVRAAAGWRNLRVRTAAGWWRLRMWKLGGTRTLGQALFIRCVMCREWMEAGAVVRALSCGHVFHRACIDAWLREHGMACRLCRRTASCVLPWKTGGRRRQR
uniref:RING-type domain-containing protein n=1 Tax=Oryza glumipatula TaxID=40148 RepID=A0A0D9ZME5_9ORYZ